MTSTGGEVASDPFIAAAIKYGADNGAVISQNSWGATPPEKTEPDQWQSQIFARVLMRARVIFISDAPDAVVRDLHMIPAHSVEEAVRMADELIGRPDAGITVIPDGVSVIVA